MNLKTGTFFPTIPFHIHVSHPVIHKNIFHLTKGSGQKSESGLIQINLIEEKKEPRFVRTSFYQVFGVG
jgi:hypothetical protein